MDKKPKCFGNYLMVKCYKHAGLNGHHKCEYGYESGECRTETNKTKGKCKCEYKASCHIMRQTVHTKYTKEKKEDCWYYQRFNQE